MKKAVTQDGGLFSGQGGSVFLGIDQSYTGFAVTAFSAEDDTYFSWLYKAEGSGIDRLMNVEVFLRRIFLELERFLLCGVAMEGYAHGAKFGREQAGELGSIVKRFLWKNLDAEYRYPCIVPPTSLKKFVCGKGGSIAKEQMLLQTYKKWGVEFTDNNLCDSYGLARVICALDSNPESLLAYERDALAALSRHTEWTAAK